MFGLGLLTFFKGMFSSVLNLFASSELFRTGAIVLIASFCVWQAVQKRERALCEERIKVSIEAAVALDVSLAKQAQDRAEQQAVEIAGMVEKLKREVEAYDTAIKKNPGCALSDDDLRALERLRR